MLVYAAPLPIWGGFSVGCYFSEGPAETVCLAIVGGPGQVGPTGING